MRLEDRLTQRIKDFADRCERLSGAPPVVYSEPPIDSEWPEVVLEDILDAEFISDPA
jgi:hypothetical protein